MSVTSSVWFSVLGPLAAGNAGGPLALPGPRHRAVLARLLVARGRVVPVDRLVDDLWDPAPAGAVGALRTFVSALRRVLEPDRPPRAPARLLVTSPPGYALRVDPDAVDARRFEAAVADSGELLASGRPASALALLDEALGWWRGPAYAGFEEYPWARAEINRLDESRLVAVERRAAALLAGGRGPEAVPDLEAQVVGHPWREEGWRLLALALYRGGRQGDALSALRRARRVLAEELGVDPGPELRRLEADVLAQAEHLLPAERPWERDTGGSDPGGPSSTGRESPVAPAAGPVEPLGTDRAGGRSGASTPNRRGRAAAASSGPAAADSALGGPGGGGLPGPHACPRLVGRAGELAAVDGAAAEAVARGGLVLALITGEAGGGKTALAEALAAAVAGRGWLVAWGANPEETGTAEDWAWEQVLNALVATGLGTAPTRGGAAAGDAVAARFRWHREVARFLAETAAHGPLLVVLDDLHHAGEETLRLLSTLVTGGVTGPVLVVGTYRTTDPPPPLTRFLGQVARAEPVRVALGGLDRDEVSGLMGSITGRPVDAATAAAVRGRTGGNPFFVRELARLLLAEGTEALAEVPPGVRDVVRYRVTRLPASAASVLSWAAVIGTEFDVAVLVAVVGAEQRVLDALDLATGAGFLVEGGAGRVRFAHALVRDAVYEELSGPRRARAHGAVADVVERLRPWEVTTIAHHLVLTGDRERADQVVRYARIAATDAAARFASEEAARWWRHALDSHDSAVRLRGASAEDEAAQERLDLVLGLVRALAVAGDLAGARSCRSEALDLAERLGDDQVVRALTAFDVPAVWTTSDDQRLARRIADLVDRVVVRLPVDRVVDRARLLATLALELRGGRDSRPLAAAEEAERLARESGDPAVVALALNARFMQTFWRSGLADQRAALGGELALLARDHSLVTFEILGELVSLQARSALGDFTAADRHATEADRLGREYQSPLVGVLTDWYRAMRTSVSGREAAGAAAYRSAAARLAGTGMFGLERGLREFASFCHQLRWDPPASAGGEVRVAAAGGDADDYEPWCRPLRLLAAGRIAEAREAACLVPESPHDLFLEARLCLRAVSASLLADRETSDRLYEELSPAEAEIAGAGSGLVALRPVAHHLGDLAWTLGRPGAAVEHYDRARALAEGVGAPHWARAAEQARAAVRSRSSRG
ncbi:BTAD domain-containing putative transcriptional regulator [Actinoalloteichus caeruleus]|uniref:BTAD domain-containing putative transcriptional regulator n=1 Tax=Actinoalloteichus cyanogriseus TaxID=2893586 RepID=UPI003BB8F18F